MTSESAWLAGYAALVVICAATVIVRREPTLLRGSLVFLCTVVYVALAWGFLAWREGAVAPRAMIAGLVALTLSAAAAPWWFVLRGPRAAVVEVIEVCFGRVCAQYERTDAGFVMAVPGGSLHVRMHGRPTSRVTVLSFRARPAHRKGDLFRRLLIKQYRGVLPTIRIRIR